MTSHLREALCDYVMWVTLYHECFQMRAYVLKVINLPILLLGRSLFKGYDFFSHMERTFKADSHTECRAHVVPLPCRTAKGLECVFPI